MFGDSTLLHFFPSAKVLFVIWLQCLTAIPTLVFLISSIVLLIDSLGRIAVPKPQVFRTVMLMVTCVVLVIFNSFFCPISISMAICKAVLGS